MCSDVPDSLGYIRPLEIDRYPKASATIALHHSDLSTKFKLFHILCWNLQAFLGELASFQMNSKMGVKSAIVL